MKKEFDSDSVKKKYVVGLMFSPDKSRVVLISKLRPDWQAGKLNGPGGHIEEGEEPEQAMRREFLEETGVDVEAGAWDNFLVMYGQDWEVWFFRVFCADYIKARTVTDECVGSIETSMLDKHPLIGNLRWVIPMAMDGDHAWGRTYWGM